MSEAAFKWAAAVDTPTANAKLTLLMLAHHHDPFSDSCRPTHRELAKGTLLSILSVRRAIRVLDAAGLITREPLTGDDGTTLGVAYQLHIDRACAAAGEKV